MPVRHELACEESLLENFMQLRPLNFSVGKAFRGKLGARHAIRRAELSTCMAELDRPFKISRRRVMPFEDVGWFR